MGLRVKFRKHEGNIGLCFASLTDGNKEVESRQKMICLSKCEHNDKGGITRAVLQCKPSPQYNVGTAWLGLGYFGPALAGFGLEAQACKTLASSLW